MLIAFFVINNGVINLFMKINKIKLILIAIFLTLFIRNSLAVPLPIPPNISIKDIIQHGKRAINKNKEDKNAQEEYKKTQKELENNIDKEKDKQEVIKQKNQLRERFNGNWSGEFVLKKENHFDYSCKIKILIKGFEGKLKTSCNDLTYTIYLFINLDRNLENSFILTSLFTEKIMLFGDITSFGGNNAGIYIKGSLEKF